MENKKILVLYVAHYINDFTLKQYYKLKNEMPQSYDIIWWLDSKCKQPLPSNITFIKFPHNTIRTKFSGWINPMKYMEVYFTAQEWFRQYDYYWTVEYDVYFNGNWSDFFNNVDKHDEDLVGTAFTVFKKDVDNWFFKNNNFFYNYFDEILKSCISIYRISNKALNLIAHYNDCEIKNYLYELYIPTILYNKGFSLLSLNSEKIVVKDEGINNYQQDKIVANHYDDCNFVDNAVETFWWNVTFYDEAMMNKPNKLYTRYKEKVIKI